MKKYTFLFVIFFLLNLSTKAQSTLALTIIGHDVHCNGNASGSAKAVVFGGVPPFTYTWVPNVGTSDSVINLSPNTYSVIVVDGAGTSISGSVVINQPDSMIVNIDSLVFPPCFRTTTGGVCGCTNELWAVVTGGTPPYSYLWNPGAVAKDTLSDACYTFFTILVTDHNNCSSSKSINIVAPTHIINAFSAVTEINEIKVLDIYPNPTSKLVNINFDGYPKNAINGNVYNIIGKNAIKFQIEKDKDNFSLDISNLTQGLYFLQLENEGIQKSFSFNVVK